MIERYTYPVGRVRHILYDKTTNTLGLISVWGNLRVFRGVDPIIMSELINARSPGTFFDQIIAPEVGKPLSILSWGRWRFAREARKT